MAEAGRKHAVKVAIGAAAVGVATTVTAVAVTQPASISAPLVDLAALIVVGSSTNPSGEGVADFFGGKFNDPIYTGDDPENPDIVYVNFSEGAAGIEAALEANADDERNAVLASGWGAANASLLLLRNNPALRDNTTLILDNDVARPDGGFGTRYPLFALIGVNPYPTPSEAPDGVKVVNIGYEYDYNSNAPAYVLNPFSAVNALAAYLTTRLNQADIDLPVDAEGNPLYQCNANTCALTEAGAVLDCPDARCSTPVGDRITAYITTRNDTTYVTYTAKELPLTTLVRSIFGDYVASVTAPLLKLAVDFGYYGGNPIPSDPSAYRPGHLFPSIADFLTMISKIPAAIVETLSAIVAPFQQSAVQEKQLKPVDEIAGITADFTLTGADNPVKNSLENGLDAVLSADGHADAATVITPGSVAPDLGAGQPTAPTQTDLTGTGIGQSTGTETGQDTGTGTGTATGTETGTDGETNEDNANNNDANNNEADEDNPSNNDTDEDNANGNDTEEDNADADADVGVDNKDTETDTGTGTGT